MRAREFQPLQEIVLGPEKELFPKGLRLDHINVSKELLQPFNSYLSMFKNLNASEVASQEEFNININLDGFVERSTGRTIALLGYDNSDTDFYGISTDPVDIKIIKVDPLYRRQGLARELYSQLRARHTLVADDSQSPAIAQLWVNIVESGIPVQGWIQFTTNHSPQELDEKYGNKYAQSLELMGARMLVPSAQIPIKESFFSRFSNTVFNTKKSNNKSLPEKYLRLPTYLFPVQRQTYMGNLVMDTAVRTPENIHVYSKSTPNHYKIGLVAWQG